MPPVEDCRSFGAPHAPKVFLRLYTGDFLKDTQHLDTRQISAYLLLIFAYWHNHGPLDDNDRAFAQITRLRMEQWKKMRPVIGKYFEHRDGKWFQHRIEKELERVAQFAATQKAKSRLGTKIRWGDPRSNDARGHRPGMPPAYPERAQSESESDSEVSTTRVQYAGTPDPNPLIRPALSRRKEKEWGAWVENLLRENHEKPPICDEWERNAGLWITRMRENPKRFEKTFLDLENMLSEGRPVHRSRGALATDIWFRFA